MSRRYGPFDPFERSPFTVQEIRIPRPPRRFWVGVGLIAAAILILALASPTLYILTEREWYDGLGLGDVFARRVAYQAWLFVGAFLVAFAFTGANVAIALRARAATPLRKVGIARRWLRSPAGVIGMLAALLLSLVLSLGVTRTWQDLVLLLNYSATGTRDPLFGQDVSFYLLQLPFLHDLLDWTLGLLFLSLLVVAALYTWRGESFDFALTGSAIAHLSVLLGILAFAFAASAWLGRYDLVYAHNGVVFGAGYADVNARAPIAAVRTGLAAAVGLALFANAAFRRLWLPALGIAVWVVGAVIGGIYPSLLQNIAVKPAELQQERPYILREIDFTRKAYALDGIQVSSFAGDQPLTAQDIANDSQTLDNLRLWDYTQLLDTYTQLQSIRTYYAFNDVDIDRYPINGKTLQLELAARELRTDRLPSQAQTWVNQRLVYTHGYGVAASPVSAVNGQGLPEYVVQDVPPTGPLTITQPDIYFGELTNDYAIAPSTTQEFDRPASGNQGSGSVYVTYSGGHGVPMDGLSRTLWAMRLGDFNLLVSPQIEPQSQMLYRRNIVARVNAIAPFLEYDHDPYVVVANGKLYWVIDAYTTASTYPYAQVDDRYGINYIRNSVKVVIDAYDGQPTFYVNDPNDPLIRAYERAFPTLFRPMSQFPDAVRPHLRVPVDMFAIQASMFATYHIQDPEVLYNREDVWDLPLEQRGPGTTAEPLQPYYVQMRLPGEKDAEFLLIQPFTPRNKTNLVGWLAIRNDAPHYGQAVAYLLPRDRVIVGPQQVSAFINQKPEISENATLLNQQGSQFILGNLLVVPIGQTFLYFQPVYLRSSSATSVPELIKVILAVGDRVAYQNTVNDALNDLLNQEGVGGRPPSPSPSPGATPSPGVTPSPGSNATVAQLVQQALQHYDQAQVDLKNGDLAGYAAEMQQVANLLQQIAQLVGVPSGPTPSPSPSVRPSPSR